MKLLTHFKITCGDVICVVGAGGKTSLIKELACECVRFGYKTLIATTTRFGADQVGFLAESGAELLLEIDGDKAVSSDISKHIDKYDVILVEADGAACRRLKGWRDDEPVIPEFTTKTVGVIDSAVIGEKLIDKLAYRVELFEDISGCVKGEFISEEHIINMVCHERGLFKDSVGDCFVYLSKSNKTPEIASKIPFPVVYGDVFSKFSGIDDGLKIDGVVMASGFSERMGENKLLLDLNDKSIIQHMLERIPYALFNKIYVVVSDDGVENICREFPVLVIRNSDPKRLKSGTIRDGVLACGGSDGAMFFVADQPFTKPQTIRNLIAKFCGDKEKIVLPVACGLERNPVIFPESLLDELANLSGDAGGKVVMGNRPELLNRINFDDATQFIDIDTEDDLEEVRKIVR